MPSQFALERELQTVIKNSEQPKGLARAASILVVASAVAHVVMPFMHPEALLMWLMMPLALICLWCSVHLWRGPTRKTWWLIAGMYIAMLFLHGVASWGEPTGAHHDHHMEVSFASQAHDILMVFTSVVSVAMIVLSSWKLWRENNIGSH